MKILRITQILGLASLMLLFVQCDDEIYLPDQATAAKSSKAVKAPSEETAGNNLSYPVLWADDYEKDLRGTMDQYTLDGEWWYVWGVDPIDPQAPLYSCEPDPENPELCIGDPLNGIEAYSPGDGTSVVYKAYVQKDIRNTWQAFNATPKGTVYVDEIDWGDDLESVNWSINSMVRAEVVLFEYLDEEEYEDKTLSDYPQFPMRHVSGWGSNEVHGFQIKNLDGDPQPAFEVVPGDLATIYSHNARFTIQKLNVQNLEDLENNLVWVPKAGWVGTGGNEDLVNEPKFNKTVYESGDGPGYYNAEINVKGKIIYGYTWKVRTLNDGEGYYRLTFSFDQFGGIVPLNTFFDEDTVIIVAEDDDDDGEEGEDGDGNDAVRGGIGYIDVANNLTYMDILITPKNSGGGKGGGNGGSGAGNGGGNGGNTGNGVPGGGKGGRN